MIAVGAHAESQASRSGCRNVVRVGPTSSIVENFSPCSGSESNKYFLAVAKNFETSNLFYLRDEWYDSGLAKDGWELLLAMNGADPGDFDISDSSLPQGMRRIWSASSLTYGVPDEDMVDMVRFSWAVVDCSLNPAAALLAAEASHLGVGTVATRSDVYEDMGFEHLLESCPLKSASGRLLRVPHQGVLSKMFRNVASNRPVPVPVETTLLIDQLLFHIAGRKEESLEVEVVRPS